MRKITILLTVLLLLAVSAYSQGIKTIGSISAGLLMQSGEGSELAINVGPEFPVVTKEDNYQILAEFSYMFSDRGYENIGEIQAIKTTTTVRKFLKPNFYGGLTGGGWHIMNSEGEDASKTMYGICFGYNFNGFEIEAAGEFVQRSGPDMYYIGLGVRILP